MDYRQYSLTCNLNDEENRIFNELHKRLEEESMFEVKKTDVVRYAIMLAYNSKNIYENVSKLESEFLLKYELQRRLSEKEDNIACILNELKSCIRKSAKY